MSDNPFTESEYSRRQFLYQTGLLLAGTVASPTVSLGQTTSLPPGKSGLRLLNDRPVNAETLPHFLDDRVTKTEHLFIRNNGLPPASVNPAEWQLGIGGESVINPISFSLEDLKSRFEQISLQLTLECGGNGRAEFDPGVPGNQWTLGAVGCPLWHGVRLRDVLNAAGVKEDAVYVGFHSADTHLSGDPSIEVISRGVPISKAMGDEAMIAWGMNNDNLHPMHGHPLRLVIAGWPGSVSGKWLTGLSIRNQIHDGAKMSGKSYRIPRTPVAPGAEVADADMKIIESLPVKSLITTPQTGMSANKDQALTVKGHAWAGDTEVAVVSLSLDFGQTWNSASLTQPVNAGAWQHFEADVRFQSKGYHEIWARATDREGVSQPMVLPGWNPKGYLNNACHRVSVDVV